MRISELMADEITLSKEEAVLLDKLIPVQEFKKGDILLEEGKIAHNCYFVISGCVRSYQIVDGSERTTQFYIEGDPVAPLSSYLNQIPANHFLACVEDTVMAVLNFENEKILYQKIPKMEPLCRINIEQEFGKQQEILQAYLTKKPEERYLMLLKTRPELLQRIPQYHLASFLGVQPESLSRIRKRIAAKD